MTTIEPQVSVIIAAYNEEKYIKECLNSILNQTFRAIEVIVVNDGSTDNTLKFIRSFNDTRIRVISQANKGRVIARNIALQESKGKYILLHDADDWSELNRIELLFKTAQKIKNKPVVGSNYTIHNEIQAVTKVRILLEKNEEIKKRMNRKIMSQAIFPPAIMIKRKDLLKIGGWREKFDIAAEDGDLLDRLYEDGAYFHNVQSSLYNYRLNKGSVTNKPDVSIPYQMFKRHCKSVRRKGLTEPDSFNEFLKIVNKNIVNKLKYKLEYFVWTKFKKLKLTI